MVNILVGVKQVVDVDSLKIDRGTNTITTMGVPRKMNDFDKNALEEALRIREKHGGRVVAVSVGPQSSRDVLKEALAMGADEAYLITDQTIPEFDSRAVSHLIARFYAKFGPFDLVIMGEGSVDHFSLQVGPRVAELLGLPQLAYTRRLEYDERSVVAERDLEDGIHVVRSPLPCVVTVAQEINQPRLPTLKSILAASKKPINTVSFSQLEVKTETLQPVATTKTVVPPKTERKKIVIDGSKPEEAVQNLIKYLGQEGLI
ncbi:MAG: electron transfer flavoprotein subunit beta/FixA family protein [Thermoprotei archaeon]